jgi:heme exporter protein B
MIAYWRASLAIYAKDLRLELRSKETVSTILVFSLLVAFIFNFAFDPSPRVVALVGPGIVWVAYVFTGILGLNRSLILEKDQDTLDGLRLAPAGRDAIYAGKLLGTFTLMLVVEALMLPVFLVLFDLSLFTLWFVVVALLATLGFAAVGTIFSAIAVNTRAREVMLPLLFLPVVLPIIIGAVSATGLVIAGGGWKQVGQWVQLMAAFDAVFIVVSSLMFEFVLEE